MKRIIAVIIVLLVGFGMQQQVQAARPAIDLAEYGAAYWSFPGGGHLDFWIRVIDYDGVGNIEQVDVEFPTISTPEYPDGISTIGLTAGRDVNAYTREYYGWLYLGNEYNYDAIQNCNFVFRATDREGHSGEASDAFVFNSISPLLDNYFNPSNRNELITANFDNIYIKRESGEWSLYDDFDSGQINTSLWQNPTGNPVVDFPAYFDSGKAVLPVENPIGRGRSMLNLINSPDTITGLKADIILLQSSSTVPKARLAGSFFGNSNTAIWTEIAIYEDRIVCKSSEDWYINGISWVGETLFNHVWEFESGLIGETVTASIEWNGSVLTFTAVVDNQTYEANFDTQGLELLSLTNTTKRLESVINLFTADDSPTIYWQAVEGASRYRVRIYNAFGNTLYNFYPETGQTSFRIPPGILRPNAQYEYRVEAWDNHLGSDADNVSVPGNRVRFHTGSASQAPYIWMEHSGVHVWHTEMNDNPYLTGYVRVYDGQGVPDNIKSVKMVHPNGDETPLFYDYIRSGSPAGFISQGIYRTDDFRRPPLNGTYTYTFIVEDVDGHSFSIQEDLNYNPIDWPTNLKINNVPAHGAILGGTTANFTWDAVPGAIFYRVELYNPDSDQPLNRVHQLSTETNSLYLPEGFLKEGTLYGVRITARREYFDQNVDNGSASHNESFLANFKTTGINGIASNTPQISLDGNSTEPRAGAFVWTLPKPEDGVTPLYWLTFVVRVNDADGVPGNIKSVKVVYPDEAKELELRYNSKIDNQTATYWNHEAYSNLAIIPIGDYKFIVEDFEGNTSEIIDNLTVTAPLPFPTNIWPGREDMVVETNPVIDWDPVSGAVAYRIRLLEGWGRVIYDSPIIYENYFELPDNLLSEGRSYGIRVYAYAEDPSSIDVDNVSTSSPFQAEKPQFTVDLLPDEDGDGIYGTLDSEPTVFSNNFSDGQSHGLVLSRGDQELQIVDRPSPDGVIIQTVAGHSGAPAQVEVCGGTATLELNAGARVLETCGSVKLNVLNGVVKVQFVSDDGRTAESTITQESSGMTIIFQPETFSFSAVPVEVTVDDPPPQTAPIEIKVDNGASFTVEENQSKKIVQIDIKPNTPNNIFNISGGGVLPVVIFGSDTFDVRDIKLDSLRLLGMNVKMIGKKSQNYQANYLNLNEDGFLDLVVHFEDSIESLQPGSDYALMSGELMNGEKFEGSDMLIVKP